MGMHLTTMGCILGRHRDNRDGHAIYTFRRARFVFSGGEGEIAINIQRILAHINRFDFNHPLFSR